MASQWGRKIPSTFGVSNHKTLLTWARTSFQLSNRRNAAKVCALATNQGQWLVPAEATSPVARSRTSSGLWTGGFGSGRPGWPIKRVTMVLNMIWCEW